MSSPSKALTGALDSVQAVPCAGPDICEAAAAVAAAEADLCILYKAKCSSGGSWHLRGGFRPHLGLDSSSDTFVHFSVWSFQEEIDSWR